MHLNTGKRFGVEAVGQKPLGKFLGPFLQPLAGHTAERQPYDRSLEHAAVPLTADKTQQRQEAGGQAPQAHRIAPQISTDERPQGVVPRDRAIQIEDRERVIAHPRAPLQAALPLTASWRSTYCR